MADEALLTFVADIVSAHVSNNSVAPEELPALIGAVYGALTRLGQVEVKVEPKREPAVSIRASVKPDHVVCLECGIKMKMLKRHVMTDHGMSPAEYRSRWGLNADYPLVAPDYAARRKELALRIGLGRKPVTPEAAPVAAPAKPRRRKVAPAE